MIRPPTSFTSRPLLATLAIVFVLFAGGGRAYGALSPAGLIDGPSSAILDVDGAAMAGDGSGGILYRKLVDGLPRLFVARFLDGAWQPPLEVDPQGQFGQSFPAIAAGEGGRLLVVWAEPWAVIKQVTNYRLMSAGLVPGATDFGPAMPVDNIGDATAAYPSLAMAPNGAAYVAYRVVTNSLSGGSTIEPLKPGDELIDVRVAYYNGQGLPWSLVGTINDHPEVTMRHPNASNGPSIGVSLNGNAVVAWQEPEVLGTARIWVRRVFGTRLGNVLAVSPAEEGGRPITLDADAPAVAVGTYGEAKIAYRLPGGAGSPYRQSEILVNTLPAETDPKGAKLAGAVAVGGAATVGPPSVSVDGVGQFQLSYVGSGETVALTGDNPHPHNPPVIFGSATAERAPTTINPEGGGVTAWSSLNQSGMSVIDAREDFAGGGWQTAQLSAPLSGPVSEPVLGGSGQGDALIAFRQGQATEPQVMAAVVKAPPSSFLAYTISGWTRANSAKVGWEPAPEAFGATTYALVVDGRVLKRGLTGLSTRIEPRTLGDGRHRVQVLATDSLGQRTMSPAAELKVDINPPQISVRALGHGRVRMRVYSHTSGAVAHKTSIVFGDGTRVNHRLTILHAYSRPGRYVIFVHSSDRLGNLLAAHVIVQVR